MHRGSLNYLYTPGELQSTEFTPQQYKYAQVVSQLTKLSLFISMRHVKIKTEAPNGMERLLDHCKKHRLDYDTMSQEQRSELENQFLYEIQSGTRLNNATSILQQILHEAHQRPEIQAMFKDYMDDVCLIASKETTNYFDKINKVKRT